MLAVDVAVNVVDYGLIWLERMLDLPTVLASLTAQGNQLMAAAVALELGLQDRAMDLLHSALHERPMAEAHIRSFAERNGCQLD